MPDFTDFAAAARANDPKVVAAFGQRFPKARLRLPLTTLHGVKNRPETAIELGASLPVHRLRLDNGGFAVALFTTLRLCRECAGKLSWETDGKPVKALVVPGAVALVYLKELLVAPGVDRVILNPLSDSALHLARTDVDSMSVGLPLRSLWFYARNGRLKVPVEIGTSSFLSAVFDMADKAFSREQDIRIESAPSVEGLPEPDLLPALTSDLYALLARRGARSMEITLTKSRNEVGVEAVPNPDPELLALIRGIAEKHLAGETGSIQVTLRIQGSSTPIESPPKSPKLDYIPLEPEDP